MNSRRSNPSYDDSGVVDRSQVRGFSEEGKVYSTASSSAKEDALPDLERGQKVLKEQIRTLSELSGVYRMLDGHGRVLYVGKARNLKARVTSYTHIARLPYRMKRMVSLTRSLVVVTTHTEAEALLLEANLIKHYKAPYNILLRDDKSYPYILLREDHDYAQITKHRGLRKKHGQYYGPFASVHSVNDALNSLQKIFLLRSCSDTVFRNRSRPCLLYQIKRCSAPCVGKVDLDAYRLLAMQARDFLSGRSQEVQKALSCQMVEASDRQDYEKAALLRDRLRSLSAVQSSQNIATGLNEDMDFVALVQDGGVTCIQIFFFRAGQSWGNRAFFPTHDKDQESQAIMAAFLSQFYEDKAPPRHVLISHNLGPEAQLLVEALEARHGLSLSVRRPQRGRVAEVMERIRDNARESLARRLNDRMRSDQQMQKLADLFELDKAPRRIEIYDNSHIQGSHALGAMVVATPDGFNKKAYRKFNMDKKDFAAGDDYAMMRSVFMRRFSRLAEADNRCDIRDLSLERPDLVLIDGGRGQLNACYEVLKELMLDDIVLVAISKGPDRNAGREKIHCIDRESFTLEPGDNRLFVLQRLRDEAHRFAIGGHRKRRQKAMGQSRLDAIPKVGAKRKKALLLHFGSVDDIFKASVRDLTRVDGISEAIARTIYNYCRGGQ